MHVEQLVAQFLEEGCGDRCVVDESPAFARCGQLTPDHALLWVVVEIVIVEKLLEFMIGDIENRLHHTSFLTRLDAAHVGSLSFEQSDGTENNRFAGSRFAGDDRKALMKVDVQPADQCVVFNM